MIDTLHRTARGFAAASLALALSLPATADDTEIFFGRSSDAFENNPNILFVLDISGSMNNKDDGVDKSRLDRMKDAMRLLLDQSSSYNVGLATFQGEYGGSAIRYPIGYLEGDNSALCDGDCPDEYVVARPEAVSDDGQQNDDSNTVALDRPTLVMADRDIAETATALDTVTVTVAASSDMAEALGRTAGDPTVAAVDMATNAWFYVDEQREATRFAYRFDAVALPADATVTAAHVTFTRTDPARQVGTLSARITAEATSDPLPYGLPGEPGHRSIAERADSAARTNAVVTWTEIPPNAASATQPDSDKVVSEDVANVLTEVAGLNGWTSGNSLSLLVLPTDDLVLSAADGREFHGAAAAATLRPELTLTYTQAADPNTESLEALASAHVDEYRDANADVAWSNTANSLSSLFHVEGDYRPRELGLRFENLAIPQGATIKTARLVLHAASGTATEDDPANWIRDPTAAPVSGGGTASEPDLGAAADDVVSLTIKAELSDAPVAYGATPLGARAYTGALTAWDNVPEVFDQALESPDLAVVVGEVVSLTDWQAGDDLSLVLSPDPTYPDLASNVRRFLTSTSAVRPKLEISWESADTGPASQLGTQTTAVRFPRVFVPPGATISNARIVFTAADSDDEPTSLTVSAERSGTSATLSEATNDIGARDRTSAREPWNPEPWAVIGQPYSTGNLASIVTELVGQNDWCAGNPMTFLVAAGAGGGRRTAFAFADDHSYAPKLEVTYSPSSLLGQSYCSNASVKVSLPDGSGDAVQAVGGGTQITDGMTLATAENADGSGAEQEIGVTFPNVRVPQGAKIVSAALSLTTRASIAGEAKLRVHIDDSDDALPYQPTQPTIDSSDRDWTGGKEWKIDGPIDAGATLESSDLRDQIQRVVDRGGWAAGNAMGFRLRHDGGEHARFISHDSDVAQSPDLIIYFESERSDPGTKVRENLKNEVDRLVGQGYTPIVSSLYEAVRYYRGEPVDYGARRGEAGGDAEHYRLSHPFSHVGGTVDRSEECREKGPDHDSCIDETLDSSPSYVSPMTSQCQSNHVVLLSDGAATRDDRVQSKVRSLIGAGSCASADPHESCGRELAAWAANTDHVADGTLPNNQTINLHTIAFALEDTSQAYRFLDDLAEEGGGGFYAATSSEQLLTAFKNIFINVSKTDTSFVSPSVTVSSQNRMKHREDIYFSLFKPEPTARWGGNLKRYRSAATAGQTADIVDVNGDIAVDGATGEFYPGARSWWSSVPDGGSVLLGGAAEQLGDNGAENQNRRVATFTGLADGGSTRLLAEANRLDSQNDRIDPALFDVPPQLAEDSDYLKTLIAWARGQDVLDNDGDGDTDETRLQMGDPMHSQPVLVNYANGDSVVFVATNEGYLHAIDTETGEERWAFIPEELLKNLHDFFQNAPTRQRPYGLDGGMTTWIEDDDRDGLVDVGEKAYLYVGMRRGGDSYYAIDISSLNDPEFLWRIAGGQEIADTDPTTADGDFTELGQTWSTPVKTRVLRGDDEVDVLVFAGGYDTSQDPPLDGGGDDPTIASRSIDGIGRTLFIVDALDGKQLWRVPIADPAFAAMRYSMPSDVRVIDIDFDGLADQLFVGDMGGQIWRFDFDNDRNVTRTLSARLSGGRIAELASDEPGEARRFYSPPDVSLISVEGRQQLSISIGSGWRAHPLDTTTQDRFYSIRSPYVYGPPRDTTNQLAYTTVRDGAGGSSPSAGFLNVTDGVPTDQAGLAKGWFIDLGQAANGGSDAPGEKVLGTSITADNRIVFTSYMPETDIGACSAAVGSGAVWSLDVRSGAPLRSVRKEGLESSGLPGDVSVHFPLVGEATVMVGTEKLDDIDIGALRRRTFWQEMLER